MRSETIVWTKTRSSDWMEKRRGEWQAVLATLLVSAYIPLPPLMMGATTGANEYYKSATHRVNAIAYWSYDSWHSLDMCPPVPCLV